MSKDLDEMLDDVRYSIKVIERLGLTSAVKYHDRILWETIDALLDERDAQRME